MKRRRAPSPYTKALFELAKERDETELIGRPHQGLLAEHVQAALERGPDQSRVARRRSADVDEVEPRVREEGFGGVEPSSPR